MKCFWETGCSDRARCREFGQCVASWQNAHKDDIRRTPSAEEFRPEHGLADTWAATKDPIIGDLMASTLRLMAKENGEMFAEVERLRSLQSSARLTTGEVDGPGRLHDGLRFKSASPGVATALAALRKEIAQVEADPGTWPACVLDIKDAQALVGAFGGTQSATRAITQHGLLDATADMLEAHGYGAAAREVRKAKKEMPDCPVAGL